jgi:hypothetical protein
LAERIKNCFLEAIQFWLNLSSCFSLMQGLNRLKMLLKKFTLFFSTYFIFLVGFGQDSTAVYSVFLTIDAGSNLDELNGFAASEQGQYTLKETESNAMRVAAGNLMGIDATGLYLKKNTILSIGRETIRENSAYTIRNGYLFGVVPNDSVLVALDGELYYYLMETKTYLFDANATKQQLYKGAKAGEYVLMANEDNGYKSMIYLVISGRSIILKELDLAKNMDTLTRTTHKQVEIDGIQTYLLTPSLTEWKSLFGCFTAYDTYLKIR